MLTIESRIRRCGSSSGSNWPLRSWMIPTVVAKPSARARRAITSASSGLRMPPPTTELIVTSNVAPSASHCSFLSSTLRLFFDTSSGITLSMLI
jgi:hypothetical protein